MEAAHVHRCHGQFSFILTLIDFNEQHWINAARTRISIVSAGSWRNPTLDRLVGDLITCYGDNAPLYFCLLPISISMNIRTRDQLQNIGLVVMVACPRPVNFAARFTDPYSLPYKSHLSRMNES
jgi:hypothetical protein